MLPAASLISVLQIVCIGGVPRDMKNYSRGSQWNKHYPVSWHIAWVSRGTFLFL